VAAINGARRELSEGCLLKRHYKPELLAPSRIFDIAPLGGAGRVGDEMSRLFCSESGQRDPARQLRRASEKKKSASETWPFDRTYRKGIDMLGITVALVVALVGADILAMQRKLRRTAK